jgi:superoxide dismutase, Fe-Mn family
MRAFKLAPFGDLSAAAIEAHLGLYKGYVEQTEAVLKQLHGAAVPQSAAAALTPRETLGRRLSFESNGARLHELFFEQFETSGAGDNQAFSIAVSQRFGSVHAWQEDVLELGKTRGPGWILTCIEVQSGLIDNHWIDLHESGIPADSPVLYVVDLWEHAYWNDYGAKGRDRYIHDLLEHSNWAVAGKRHQQVLGRGAIT